MKKIIFTLLTILIMMPALMAGNRDKALNKVNLFRVRNTDRCYR